MALNLNLLRSFWQVAQAGSVSGAAQASFVSQPALSKAVKELERQLGVSLFERGARGVTLTAAGAALYEHARAIFALEREAEDAVRASHELRGVTLRVGASTTIATYILPQLLAEFRALHPGVGFSLTRDNTARIESLLLDFALDVALVEGPPHDERIGKTRWRDEEMICVCAPSHPLAKRRRLKMKDLKNCDWLVREKGSGTREVLETALREWGLPPAGALEVGGAELIKQCVAANLGIAWVSREAAADQLALGKVRQLKISGFTLRRPFYWLRLPQRPLSPAARAFEKFLLPKA